MELLRGSFSSFSCPRAGQGCWRAGDTQVLVGNVVKDVLVVLSPHFMESQEFCTNLTQSWFGTKISSSVVFNPDNVVALLVLNSSLRPVELELNVFPIIPQK